ncbi:VOC family protein [Aquibium sp. A9E412]|uniref:VOC family protein n=1 Tax=Aquibium sp. A9E412 TaxID=2976767 RepID=UPI0025B011B3|nr:VOC family protein [Aquibium sp. A9E412]MDN2566455.1 VOC family protein [Aquibium sp. A9E412]
MTVKRIVANLPAGEPAALAAFYRDLFALETVMDHGWILTLAGSGTHRAQLGFASEGGNGTPVPDLSIEVEDVDALHARAVAAGHAIVYGPADEPWGVRRFFLRDPAGRLINVLSHR